MMQTEDPIRAHLRISGQVQGVGYRHHLRQKALELGLTGWCRNVPSGQVEAEVFGTPHAVDALIQWCHQGPPLAQVTQVETQDMPGSEAALSPTFEIRR